MKNTQSRADLEGIRDSILRITDLLSSIINRMKATGVTSVLIHTKDAENKHIPALWKWALKARSEAELQLELGRSDKMAKSGSAKGKKAAAKTPPRKAAKPKKKSPKRSR